MGQAQLKKLGANTDTAEMCRMSSGN